MRFDSQEISFIRNLVERVVQDRVHQLNKGMQVMLRRLEKIEQLLKDEEEELGVPGNAD